MNLVINLEDRMKCINDIKEPTLVGIMDNSKDYMDVDKMVKVLNQDLKDSGFEQYKFSVKKDGDRLYIEKD